MRIALIGCMVMNREINHLVSTSPNIIRAWWLRQGLHDTPDILRRELQRTIDSIEEENKLLEKHRRFQRIVLGYGLCSNGVMGLKSRSLPIIIPRCDDCISLFMGSADRYRELFQKLPGAYWYNPGWVEQAFVPSTENYTLRRQEYVEAYGEENADYLMECTNSWMHDYKACGYISCPLCDNTPYQAYAQKAAADFHWDFVEIEGDMTYFDALINGPWDDERFLTCLPHCRVDPDYSKRKFCCVPL